MLKQFIQIFMGALLLAVACLSSAQAADRTVCFNIQFRDMRFDCPLAGTPGARRPCSQNGTNWPVGQWVELWDKDWNNGDDLIGTWVIGGEGRQCITFPWEGRSYQQGEENPDLYLKLLGRASSTRNSSIKVIAAEGLGEVSPSSWRNGPAGNPEQFVAMNCRGRCDIFPGGVMIPANDPISDRALRIMALDTAQHSLEIYGSQMRGDVTMFFPGRFWCPTSCAYFGNTIEIAARRANHGFVVAHEMGHIVQMQEFNSGVLIDHCGLNGDGHSLNSIEFESCATAEGWANYVGAVTWFDPENRASRPMGFGRDMESPFHLFGPGCFENSHNELQVARAFWDLGDSNNELGEGASVGFDDTMAASTLYIARGWREFPAGIWNRHNFELDPDGVNVFDYFFNNQHRYGSILFEGLIMHNCMIQQTVD